MDPPLHGRPGHLEAGATSLMGHPFVDDGTGDDQAVLGRQSSIRVRHQASPPKWSQGVAGDAGRDEVSGGSREECDGQAAVHEGAAASAPMPETMILRLAPVMKT
ncbi:hypothetical protein [Micromonospora sp. NBC_00362]|uniref:hypothetical protein n=1 Tax=Micromonospora sp. NBC_00362 TaxID=2975975 RepID=UPI0022517D3B|nr:hypothetical protein [Micromonospora sp. NBC_00362]